MRSLCRKLTPLFLSVILASPILTIGCRSQENNDYVQWERETHRDHLDLNKRNDAEQRQYQDWRQSHHH